MAQKPKPLSFHKEKERGFFFSLILFFYFSIFLFLRYAPCAMLFAL